MTVVWCQAHGGWIPVVTVGGVRVHAAHRIGAFWPLQPRTRCVRSRYPVGFGAAIHTWPQSGVNEVLT